MSTLSSGPSKGSGRRSSRLSRIVPNPRYELLMWAAMLVIATVMGGVLVFVMGLSSSREIDKSTYWLMGSSATMIFSIGRRIVLPTSGEQGK